MPKGESQAFRVELMPDFDQKKAWKALHESAKSVAQEVRSALGQQSKSLGFLVAKNLFLEGNCARGSQGALDELAFQHVREWTYDTYEPSAGRRASRANVPVRVEPEDVSFSVSDNAVRIPHLGTVRHRPNRKIVPGEERNSEKKQWLLANVTSMCLREVGYALCLVVDTSDAEDSTGESLLTGKGKSSKRRKRKLPTLLE